MGEGRVIPTESEKTKEEDKETVVRFKMREWHVDALRLLLEDEACRYVVMNGGILTAKTSFAAALVLELMERLPGEKIWWIAGLDWQLEAFWEEFEPKARELGFKLKRSPYKRAEHHNGCVLMAVTAGNEDRIASFHPKFIFGDEVAKWKPHTYELVRLRLLKGASAFFFSTPRSTKHWKKIVKNARHKKDPKREWDKVWRSENGRWALIECNTFEAGIASEEDLEDLRHDLSPDLWQQDVEGLITEGGAGVFRNVHALATGNILLPKAKEQYRVGFDHAKTSDWGVISVRKIRTNQIVKMERYKNVDYHFLAERAVVLSYLYNKAEIVYDATGPGGEMMGEILELEPYEDGTNPYLLGISWDLVVKARMIERLSVRFAEKQIKLVHPKCGDVYEKAVDELVIFERGRFAKGIRYTYGAPSGQHDDCVDSICLAFEGDGMDISIRSPRSKDEKEELEARRKGKSKIPKFLRQGMRGGRGGVPRI